MDLNTIKATAALLKSEREANYDEFKLTDGDVDGKSLAELKENIDKYALAFKANVENAIA